MSGQISRENGKHGGRPKGTNAITAEMMRERIAEMLEPQVKDIVQALIKKAKKGDIRATKELFDRAYGKSVQLDKDDVMQSSIRGLPIPILNGLSIRKEVEL